jgi:Tfp pilus assembly protein PilO
MKTDETDRVEKGNGLGTVKRWAETIKVIIALLVTIAAVGTGANQIVTNTGAIAQLRADSKAMAAQIQENKIDTLKLEGKLDVIGAKLDALSAQIADLKKGK